MQHSVENTVPGNIAQSQLFLRITSSHHSSGLVKVGSALRHVADVLKQKSHAYVSRIESVVEQSISHPVETIIENEPWLLFSVCFSAITSVSLLLSSKSNATNELVFDKACLILWVACSFCMFVSVSYTNSATMGSVWISTYLTEIILSLENMLAYHAVFSLHRVHSSDRPKGLYWGIGLAMFIRFVFLLVGGAIMAGSSIVRLATGGVLVVGGTLTLSLLFDAAYQRRAKAFQIASAVCSYSESMIPAKWWTEYTTQPDEVEAPVLLQGQSKWAVGVPIFVTILAIELCDSFLTMWNTFSVVAQTSSLFVTYSSTAFALMTVRSLYLVMVGQNTALEPRMKYTNVAAGFVMITVGSQLLLASKLGQVGQTFLWNGTIMVIGLGLAGMNLISYFRRTG
jgi:predicted tellurium resistance membrane protein TerC